MQISTTTAAVQDITTQVYLIMNPTPQNVLTLGGGFVNTARVNNTRYVVTEELATRPPPEGPEVSYVSIPAQPQGACPQGGLYVTNYGEGYGTGFDPLGWNQVTPRIDGPIQHVTFSRKEYQDRKRRGLLDKTIFWVLPTERNEEDRTFLLKLWMSKFLFKSSALRETDQLIQRLDVRKLTGSQLQEASIDIPLMLQSQGITTLPRSQQRHGETGNIITTTQPPPQPTLPQPTPQTQPHSHTEPHSPQSQPNPNEPTRHPITHDLSDDSSQLADYGEDEFIRADTPPPNSATGRKTSPTPSQQQKEPEHKTSKQDRGHHHQPTATDRHSRNPPPKRSRSRTRSYYSHRRHKHGSPDRYLRRASPSPSPSPNRRRRHRPRSRTPQARSESGRSTSRRPTSRSRRSLSRHPPPKTITKHPVPQITKHPVPQITQQPTQGFHESPANIPGQPSPIPPVPTPQEKTGTSGTKKSRQEGKGKRRTGGRSGPPPQKGERKQRPGP